MINSINFTPISHFLILYPHFKWYHLSPMFPSLASILWLYFIFSNKGMSPFESLIKLHWPSSHKTMYMGIYAHIHNILLSIWRLADPLKLSPLHLSQVLLFFSLKSFMSTFSLHFQSSHPHTSLTAIIFLLLPNTSGFILNATYTQIRFNYFFSSKISFNIFIYSKVSLSVF